jgi:ribosomal protein L32
LHKREAERGPSARIKQGSQQKKNRHRSHKQATLSLLMVVSSHCGATGGAATPCPVMQGKSGTRNTQKACNQKPHHPCAPEGVPMREGEKKVNSEDGRQGDAWEGHALKSHCSAPEHTAKAQGKSKPAGGGQQSPSGLSAKTS